MVIKLYYDLMSQPSRVLYILLKYINCDFEPKYINLRQVEHFSYEFTTINRMQKVPVIDHNGFILSESIAILKYLSRENIIPDALYPKDSKLQARVEEFLEWYHIGLRLHCAMFFRVAYMNPILTGVKLDASTVDNYKRRMLTALEDLDTKWLGRGSEYIVGDTITVADLVAACELEQPRMASFDPAQHYPNVAAWWPKVQRHFSPHYEEGHTIANKIINKSEQVSSKI